MISFEVETEALSITFSRNLVFQVVENFHPCSSHLRMLGRGLLLRTTVRLVSFLWLVNALRNF